MFLPTKSEFKSSLNVLKFSHSFQRFQNFTRFMQSAKNSW